MSTLTIQEKSDEVIEQEVQVELEGHSHSVLLDSSLSQFRTDPGLRPYSAGRPLHVVFKIPCTDGIVEVPATAAFMGDIGKGPTYRLSGLNDQRSRLLLNHLDNGFEGLAVSREQLYGDKAPPLDVRDAQVRQKNLEVTEQLANASTQKRKQWALSIFFLCVIAFFGWLIASSLFSIVSEDMGQQTYYTHIASARLRMAEAQLKEVEANLDFTRTMVTRMHDPAYKGVFTQLQGDVFNRDLLALQAHQEQLQDIIEMLKLNKSEVAKGNFFYERRVFDSFTTQDRTSNDVNSAQLLTK